MICLLFIVPVLQIRFFLFKSPLKLWNEYRLNGQITTSGISRCNSDTSVSQNSA